MKPLKRLDGLILPVRRHIELGQQQIGRLEFGVELDCFQEIRLCAATSCCAR